MKEFGITYPVVLDNDYGTWNAYGNRFWPRKYLIDINGNVVYDHIGEGAYEAESEATTTYGVALLLPEAETPITTGSSGKIHGASTVSTPAAKDIRRNVILLHL